jgi:uncharacterized membrane protein
MRLVSAPLNNVSKSRVHNRSRRRRVLDYLKTPLIGASVVSLLDSVVLQPVFGSMSKTTLVLVLFLEGSIGLIAGSAIALSSTPSISKTGEFMFGRAPWSREGERNAERVAGKWMIASTLLILGGFALSAT